MYKNSRVTAIITAAGTGRRMNAEIPKQFLKMSSGKTILESTVEQLDRVDMVDRIIIILSPDQMDRWRKIFERNDYSTDMDVVEGGAERQFSVRNAVCGMAASKPSPEDILLIHDGVRPYASQQLIEKVIEAAYDGGAAIAAVPAKDTIRHASQGVLDRNMLYNVQTPQAFKFSIIKEAFDRAEDDGYLGTDESCLVERLGVDVHIVPGEEKNIKITTPEDLERTMRVGTGFDVHRLVDGRPLILGGVNIPFHRGLLGHSDADVAVHALMDAILGASALGDIGQLFPDSDAKYEGISSITLLEEVGKLVRDHGFQIINADVTIICQKPKLASHIGEMRKNISRSLKVQEDCISVKATTTEKLGFTGKGEGIATEAVCLLKR